MGDIRNSDGIWINTQVFREDALHFQKYGYYCPEPWGSPAWYEYWTDRRNRIINGYESQGVKITGDHYFYMNFCPIKLTETKKGETRKGKKVRDFPHFWDGDYNFFWAREIAYKGVLEPLGREEEFEKFCDLHEDNLERTLELKKYFETLGLDIKIEKDYLLGGWNLIVGKSRRKGYSFKNASIGAKNYFTKPESVTFYTAYEKKYLTGSNAIFPMVLSYINFINEHTAWVMPSDYIDTKDRKRASYEEIRNGVKLEKGFKSEVTTETFRDNPDALRGKDSVDIFIEEAGAFGTPGLLKASLAASEDCVKDGEIKTGMITIFGCVCKGTKVWNNDGKLVNIEDITKESGIIGYASKGTIEENISWLQPPAKKECVRIVTENGNSIECSTDHPLLSKYKDKYKGNRKIKTATFTRAEDLKVGDYLLEVRQMPKFGDKQMWNPRLVGLLIGDRYYGSKNASSQLCISEPELIDYIDTLDVKYKIYKGKSSDTPYFRYITLQATQEQLKLLGMQGQSCKLKRLPSNIWDYNKNTIAELLGGLFDADGYVGTQGKRKKIALTSVVYELLKEVKIQLYKLGINSKIYKRKHKPGTILKSHVTGKTSYINTNISYSLEICDLSSIRNFKKHIKLIVKKKQNVINSWDLDIKKNEDKQEYEYVHTIEKGDYFIQNNKLEYLKSTKIVSIEDIGMQDIYNLSAEYTHTYITNNFISHNTSGDMEGGTADYAEMFNNPKRFSLLPMENIWEEDEKLKGSVGFFHPVNWNMPGYYDEQGNSDREGAKQLILNERKRLIDNGATATDIQQKLQEKPLTPSEAFSYTNINIFPTVELKRQRDIILANQYHKLKAQPVVMYRDPQTNQVISEPDLTGKLEPILSLEHTGSLEGCPVIYEYPINNAPKGLYKIGYDPISQDKGTSLAAIVVYKSTMVNGYNNDMIVAEYIGRKETPDDVHLIAELFADLYNTQIMFENMVPDVKTYFQRRKMLHKLCLQPDAVISKNVKSSKVSRVYGCHMNAQLKDAGTRYIKQWLTEIVDFDEHGHPVNRIGKIYSLRLIEELLSYNEKGNFDLVSALIMCMFQVQEEVLGTEYEEKRVNSTAKKLLEMMKRTN